MSLTSQLNDPESLLWAFMAAQFPQVKEVPDHGPGRLDLRVDAVVPPHLPQRGERAGQEQPVRHLGQPFLAGEGLGIGLLVEDGVGGDGDQLDMAGIGAEKPRQAEPATPGPAMSAPQQRGAARAGRQRADGTASGSRRPSTNPPGASQLVRPGDHVLQPGGQADPGRGTAGGGLGVVADHEPVAGVVDPHLFNLQVPGHCLVAALAGQRGLDVG